MGRLTHFYHIYQFFIVNMVKFMRGCKSSYIIIFHHHSRLTYNLRLMLIIIYTSIKKENKDFCHGIFEVAHLLRILHVINFLLYIKIRLKTNFNKVMFIYNLYFNFEWYRKIFELFPTLYGLLWVLLRVLK